MKCAWQAFYNLLPMWLRESVSSSYSKDLLELRLRLQQPPELVTRKESIWLDRLVVRNDLMHCVNAASRYSPWSSTTIGNGYITAMGGHRIGVGGQAILEEKRISGMRDIGSICIRIARDIPGISQGIDFQNKSILIIGPPGAGKTTLLRDLIRRISDSQTCCVGVVDEKMEIFPVTPDGYCFPVGRHTDIISGCNKTKGIDMALRNLSPAYLAVDEITAEGDCDALVRAGWCGVRLLATAHAGNMQDLCSRPVYAALIEKHLFDTVVILQRDKSWNVEGMHAYV